MPIQNILLISFIFVFADYFEKHKKDTIHQETMFIRACLWAGRNLLGPWAFGTSFSPLYVYV